MKTASVTLSPLIFLALVVIAAGCSRRDRDGAEAKMQTAYEQTKAAAANTWERVKSFTFEQRDKFVANARELSAKMDAQIDDARARMADEKASESRRAAWAELKDANADYKAKLAALGHASADSWESAKRDAISSWDRLQAAYAKARGK